MAAPYEETCFNAIVDLDDALQEALPDYPYFVVGGIATAAYRHEQTIFDTTTRTAVVPPDANMGTRRQNHTLRDVDVLVGGILDPAQAQHAKQAAEHAIGGRLEVSLFGFESYESNISRRLEPLSHRLQNRAGECFYKMGAVVQKVPSETYEQPWRLMLPSGKTVNALHPVGHALAYEVRSVGGLRGKDREKHTAMTQIVSKQLGETALAEAETQFAAWRQFAQSLEYVRKGKFKQITPESLRPGASHLELLAMRAQGKALGVMERQERIVSLAQSPRVQRMLKVVIGNA